MLFDIEGWLNTAIKKLQETFSDRLLFVGLQGSYNRGEATSDSDIDLVVILNKLDFDDLKLYRKIIDEMPDKEKACGFISGKNELLNWSKHDLFQFFYDTKPLLNTLEDIIHPPTVDDVKKAIKISSETIYHAAIHSFVHSNRYAQDLENLYKMTFFVLQAKYFVENNSYVKTKNELLPYLKETDHEILNICLNRKEIMSANNFEIEDFYKKIIEWACKNIYAK